MNGKEKTKDEFHFHFKETCYKNRHVYETFYLDGNQENSNLEIFFLVRDQRLGANVGSVQGPTGLGKYLMRSPTGEVIFGGETMRFWDMQKVFLDFLDT